MGSDRKNRQFKKWIRRLGDIKAQPLTVWRTGGFSASYDSFVVEQTIALRIKNCVGNPPVLQAANRVWFESITHETSNWMLFAFRFLPSGGVSKYILLLLMKIGSGERQGPKGQSKSVQVGTTVVSWTKVSRSMKPRKGKMMSKAGVYICICDRNITDTELRVVSHTGLRRQA